MIPLSQAQWQTETWQEQLSGAFRRVEDLLTELALPPNEAPYELDFSPGFALRVPQAFVSLMQKGDWYDPLLLQVLPLAQENIASPGYSNDPLEESHANPVPGIIHKYHGRVLLVASPACAVNCRYCFRRHFPYGDNQLSRSQWQQALDYVRERADISEVILSGGDPLVSSDDRIEELVLTISEIPTVERLRIHTRFPVVLPDRISDKLVASLTSTRLQTVFVLHCNHPNEVGAALSERLQLLRQAGVTLLNQSVLLHGINDDAKTLCKLSEKLFNAGVLPYYLHVLDRVQGAAHFALSDTGAQALHKQMMEALPGYLVPKLVREDPRVAHKCPL